MFVQLRGLLEKEVPFVSSLHMYILWLHLCLDAATGFSIAPQTAFSALARNYSFTEVGQYYGPKHPYRRMQDLEGSVYTNIRSQCPESRY